MLDRPTVRELLRPFDVSLSDAAIDRLLEYLVLLLRWNRKINLTSIATPEECITRHFGESFFVSHVVKLRGRLLDIGSGAGFPGLALKLLLPDLEVVLLEPVAKKRAFLKEVGRACGMSSVRVEGSRVQEFAREERLFSFDGVTIRAVGGLGSVIPAAAGLLKPNGHLCLWVGEEQVAGIRDRNPGLRWLDPVPIPLSKERQILAGRLERSQGT
ncbi:MAG: 16S rRNA (guanine(527)-N(7))-methyltransferase RsmG [Acidobacteriota bacterium]